MQKETGKYEKRKAELHSCFDGADETQKKIISRLIEEVVHLESRMDELRKMPQISAHPRNPAVQKATVASKQYKECSQSYMNAIRILLSVANKLEEDAQNELLKRLEEFSL